MQNTPEKFKFSPAYDGSVKLKQSEPRGVVIVGAGLAGLYAALNTDPALSCVILAKEEVETSNSYLAQGGIAAAIAVDDKPLFHVEDTLAAGAGLCDRAAVEVLCGEGPSDIARLLAMRVPFDLEEDGELSITREGGHHMNRILHAGGDATGREAVKTLAHIAKETPNIDFREHTCFYDIVTDADGTVEGCVVAKDGEFEMIPARSVIIATGGIGQVYGSSTNPAVATGDGIAAAIRAGAELENMEFVQFHPTGLWTGESSGRSFLISEAVRGEGGLLKNKAGVRFMEGVHELNELAPRDIVARAIFKEITESGEPCAFIDVTAKPREFLEKRFPTIFGECLKRGIDISKDRIPVRPVQHYFMGGIKTDLRARTNIPGLYACGEAAYSGVHGANRLASNSMLECLVFGRRAAEDVNSKPRAPQPAGAAPSVTALPERAAAAADLAGIRRKIQSVMTAEGYVVRTLSGLAAALGGLEAIKKELEAVFSPSQDYLETLNIATVACGILQGALARTRSVGAH
ncbi:MAG: L-aspartate oxidase, partial [Oscillospiraceae bacterium]|nr:L-aspartate oxidase [Oscillospiraceae bacterium]